LTLLKVKAPERQFHSDEPFLVPKKLFDEQFLKRTILTEEPLFHFTELLCIWKDPMDLKGSLWNQERNESVQNCNHDKFMFCGQQ